MDGNLLVWLIGIGVALFIAGRWSRNSEIESLVEQKNSKIEDAENRSARTQAKLVIAEREKRKTERSLKNINELYSKTLADLQKDSALLPSLVRWSERLQESFDTSIVLGLTRKKRPAKKAAEEVKLARAKARSLKKESDIVMNRLDLYESLAPWLSDYVDISVGELLTALREEEARRKSPNLDEDPVTKYISKSEWTQLSPGERNQLALDRYLEPSRKRSLWRVGIDYERFVGYQLELKGYSVEYHGATQGKEDLGIDLICKRDTAYLVVQCKRLSRVRQVPVRENVISQVYGAAAYFRMSLNETCSVTPVLITSYVLSDQARLFAKFLGVQATENYEIGPYPMIKCNISQRDGEKIYHLPMDQQYDKVIVGDVSGEFYAATVAEAEAKGFRRAFRWKGSTASDAP